MSRLTAAATAAFALMFAPLAVPLLRFRVFAYGDMAAFHVPMRFIYRRALLAGDSFLWTSALGSGLYLHAEGQTGMAHPFHLLLYRLLPLTVAINLEMLGAYAAATAGMWLLLRELHIRSDAALGGSLAFAFGGFMLAHNSHLTAIVVAAHLPWAVLCAAMLTRRDDGRSRALAFAGLAAVIGSQALLGFPQVVWMTALVVAWFLALRIATGTPLRHVWPVAIAMLLGLAIGGVQLLPTLDAARESFRSATTIPFRMSFSLHPINLVQFVSPLALKDGIYAVSPDEWFPHEFIVYDGALATLSVAWLLGRRREWPHRSLATGFGALLVIALLISLGRYGGIYPLLARLPVLSAFRASARHVLIVHFALAGLVAVMLDDLAEGRGAPLRRWLLAVPAVLSILVLAIVVVGSGWLASHGIQAGRPFGALIGSTFAVATAALIIAAMKGSRGAVVAVVVIAGVDLAARGLPYVYRVEPVPIGAIQPVDGLPRDVRPGDLVHPRVVLDEMNKYALWRLRSSLAYLGLARSDTLDPHALVTERLAGVAFTFTAGQWERIPDPMPRVRFVTSWRSSADVAADVGTIDIARTALVDGAPGTAAGPAGEARLVEERAGRFRVATQADSTQLLVFTERFHDGWRAAVDGVPSAMQRVYGDYLGCLVPAGTHDVTLVFAPDSARHGAWLTLAGVLSTLAMAAGLYRTKR